MTSYKNYILPILTFFCSHSIFAEYKLAILKDPDGFTNVLNGPGKDFRIVDSLYTDDFLYFQLVDNPQWVKISAWKGRQIEGFIRASRVQEIEKLASTKQYEIISTVLNKRRLLKDNLFKTWNSNDSLSYRASLSELKIYNDTKYEPILEILPRYFCSTKDIKILQLFFASIWQDKSSINEMPSFTMGSFFICNSDLVIKQLYKIKSIEQKKSILNHIDWGLQNYFGVEQDAKTNNQEYKKFKARLDIEIKKVSP